MKLNIKHIVILLVAAVTLMACDRGGLTTTGQPILLAPTEAGETRAMLDSISFKAVGNQIRVYDYYTPTSGNPEYYINDIAQSNGNSWPFLEKHEWTPDGVHKFFGWLEKDVNMGDETLFTIPENSFDEEDMILTLPSITLTQDCPQYDFMYSNITERDLNNNPNFGPVILGFHHLFTAFKITAVNMSNAIIKLKTVTITGLKNKRIVHIDYTDEAKNLVPSVTYSDMTSVGSFTFNGPSENLTDSSVELGTDYVMMWPHTQEQFETDVEDDKIIVSVNYAYTETSGSGYSDDDVTKELELKDMSWLAGSKYDINLVFTNKRIDIHSSVVDWEPVEEFLDFTNQVQVIEPLTWDKYESLNEVTGEVVLIPDVTKVAECTFKLGAPTGASWNASLIPIAGSADAFSFVDGTDHGSVGEDSIIKIKVNSTDGITRLNKSILRITVQTIDGRSIVVKNLMPLQNPNIEEFTIIQNPTVA